MLCHLYFTTLKKTNESTYDVFLKRKKKENLKNSSKFPTISKPIHFPSDNNIPLSLWCTLPFIFFS